MFGYNYKITPVNIEKNVYKLAPTKGTYVKAFAGPFVIIGVVLGIITAVEQLDEAQVLKYDPDKKKFRKI